MTPDSPRWCRDCQAWTDHHTDHCPKTQALFDAELQRQAREGITCTLCNTRYHHTHNIDAACPVCIAQAEARKYRQALEQIWNHPTDMACDGECAKRMNAIAGEALRPKEPR